MKTFRKEVTVQAILYVAHHMGDRKDIHKICKVLYFADQAHLSRYGRTITGDRYIAMSCGPVPSNVEDMFKALRGGSCFSDCVADLDYLSKSDVECLDTAIKKCEGKSFGELTRMSRDQAWRNTSPDCEMSVKDILREAGDFDEYIDYIDGKLETEKAFA